MAEVTESAPPAPRGGGPWKPKFNPWLIAVVVAMAAFMEVLDTSIANVALPHMAGNLGASNDESTWVLTSYLVSNAIVLPISGWLAGLFGRKRFFSVHFPVHPQFAACGAAPSLGMLIVFRVIQGVGGGGLQPMAQAILADTFPPQKRGLAFALYGITTIMAPTIGPTLGGWITDNYSWRWIFYINLPVGILTLFLVYPHGGGSAVPARVKGAGVRVDYIGIALLALGVGALQVLLDKGQEDDWFGSHFIVTLMLDLGGLPDFAGLLGMASQDARDRRAPVQELQLRHGEPDDVHPGRASVQQPGDDAAVSPDADGIHGAIGRAGSFGRPHGAVALMPIVGQLTTKIPAKYIIAFGWLVAGLAMYYSTVRVDLLISFQSAVAARGAVVRPRLSVRADHAGGLHRDSSGKEQ
jgi:DHA2 family multidrug resistance protein